MRKFLFLFFISFQASALSDGQKFGIVNGAGVLAITGWGVYQWEYFTRTPHFQDEGWLDPDTKHGGVDKIGHAYASYLHTHLITSAYEAWGISKEKAPLYGALTAWSWMGYMELGDSFSYYGFSKEDFVFNSIGVLLAYLHTKYPSVNDLVDFRYEWWKPFSEEDIFTDYNNYKFLIALKTSGIPTLRESNWTRFFELHYGFYVRGYGGGFTDQDRKRYTYFAFGLNVSELLESVNFSKVGRVFNYFQLPHTYLDYNRRVID